MTINKRLLWECRNCDVLPGCEVYRELLWEYKMRTKKELDECRSIVGNWTFIDWFENGYITEEKSNQLSQKE